MTNAIGRSNQVVAKKYPDSIAYEPGYFSFLETVLLRPGSNVLSKSELD
jgi:hypothetical protein